MISSTVIRAGRALSLAIAVGAMTLAQSTSAYAASPTNRQHDVSICKDGNWRNLQYVKNGLPTYFKNQGECVSHVARGGAVIGYTEAG